MYNEAPALMSCEDHCLAAAGGLLGAAGVEMVSWEKFVYQHS